MAPFSLSASGSVWLIAVAARRMQLKVPIRFTSSTFLKIVEVVRRLVLAVAPDGAGGPADAGGGDEGAQRAELLGRLDRRDHLVDVGDVGLGEDAVDVLGHRLALLRVHVDDDALGAALGEVADGGLTEARGPSGDDR